MLTVLALLSAGSAPAGCFNGGAFVGAQAGFARLMLKKEAAAKPITQADATAQIKKITDAAGIANLILTIDKVVFNKAPAADTYQVSIDLSDLKVGSADDKTKAAQRVVDALNKALAESSFKTAKTVTVVALNPATQADQFASADLAGAKVVTDWLSPDNTKKYSANLVAADAETKYTSNNGFAGIHAGYLGRVNDKCLVGGLVEGNWVFGKGLTPDGGVEDKDTFARFNAGVFLRAMFNLTHNFMAGADLGFAMQEFRQFKQDASGANTKDKESKFFWNPAARVVLGFALTDNILATAHFGGVFPMLKQDSLRSTAVKTKYSNWNGGVGISYAFGA